MSRLIPASSSPTPPPPPVEEAAGAPAAAATTTADNDNGVKKKRVQKKKKGPLMGYFLTDMIESVIKSEIMKHLSPSAASKRNKT